MSKNKFLDAFSRIGIDVSSTPQNQQKVNDSASKTNDFFISNKDESVRYIVRRLREATDATLELQKGKDINLSALTKLLESTELMRREIRILASNSLDSSDTNTFSDSSDKLSSVVVSSPSGTYLQLELYPLVRLPIKGGYNVYFDVKTAVQQYLREHDVCIPEDNRFTLIYAKITTADVKLAKGRCDNDNFEMKRVTNAITDAIGIADSVDKFSFFYTTIHGNEDKTIVKMVPEIDVI